MPRQTLGSAAWQQGSDIDAGLEAGAEPPRRWQHTKDGHENFFEAGGSTEVSAETDEHLAGLMFLQKWVA